LVLVALRSEPGTALHRPIILVVEDDIVIRSPLAEYLRGAGYAVIEAANAAEATALFAAGTAIDLVFSDIRMPGPMDGFGLSRWIRQHHPAVRVALTSGAGNAARAAGVAEFFVSKPYRTEAVAARIGRLLGEPAARSAPPSNPSAAPSPPGRRRSGRRPR
jgi:CheY-like chemotaxis protein